MRGPTHAAGIMAGIETDANRALGKWVAFLELVGERPCMLIDSCLLSASHRLFVWLARPLWCAACNAGRLSRIPGGGAQGHAMPGEGRAYNVWRGTECR